MEDNYRFAEGDSILCYHKQILYEAKCLKRRKTSDNTLQYFVHYKGWKSTWDEWLDESQIEPVNEENLEKMVSLKNNFIPKKNRATHPITVVKEKTIGNPNTKNEEVDSKTLLESNTNFNVSSPGKSTQKTQVRRNNIPIASKIEPPEGINLQDHNSTSEKKTMYKRRQPLENSLIPNKQVCQYPKTPMIAKIKPTEGTNLQMRNSELLVQKRVSNLNKHTGISIKSEYQDPKTLITPKKEPTEKPNTQDLSSNGEEYSGKNPKAPKTLVTPKTEKLNTQNLSSNGEEYSGKNPKAPKTLVTPKTEKLNTQNLSSNREEYSGKNPKAPKTLVAPKTEKLNTQDLSSNGEEYSGKNRVIATNATNAANLNNHNMVKEIPSNSVKDKVNSSVTVIEVNTIYNLKHTAKVSNTKLNSKVNKTVIVSPTRGPNFKTKGQDNSTHIVKKIEPTENIDLQGFNSSIQKGVSKHHKCLGMSSKKTMNIQPLRKPKSNKQGQSTSIGITSTIETIPEIIDLTQSESEEECVHSSKKISLRKPESNKQGQSTSIGNTSTIETIPEIIDLTQPETEEKSAHSSKKCSTDKIVLNIIVNGSE